MATVPPLPKSFEEAARHQNAVEEELDRVCRSVHFRTSKRSCEFLQYIVRVSLNGRTDSLKERSIGIDLFGRDSSYEPSSDATVRVRANEVRKRLSSYYASSEASAEIRTLQIELPTGSYVPRFVSVETILAAEPQAKELSHSSSTVPSAVQVFSLSSFDKSAADTPATVSVVQKPAGPIVPPVQVLTLMRPALLALLICTLLLRHQLENREEYLRFWDHLLTGRSALVLSVSPQDRLSLASSLYPLVWVAGSYGIDATMQGDSLTDAKPEATSSVQVSYTTPPNAAADPRLRWSLGVSSDQNAGANAASASPKPGPKLVDRRLPYAQSATDISVSSAALLTIFPEDSSTLHVQGTDADAIRKMLEELTVERNFPAGLVEQVEHLEPHHALQVLVYRNSAGEWCRDIFWGNA